MLIAPRKAGAQPHSARMGYRTMHGLVCAYRRYRDGYLGIAPDFKLIIPAQFYELPWLFPIGICTADFTSADYFPIFPRIFLFLAGTYFGIFVKSEKLPAWVCKTRVKPVAWLGRKALLVYIAYVPISTRLSRFKI